MGSFPEERASSAGARRPRRNTRRRAAAGSAPGRATEGFSPVRPQVFPEIQLRPRQPEGRTRGPLQTQAGKADAHVAPNGNGQIAGPQQLLQIVEAAAVRAVLPKTVAQSQTLVQAELRRGKTDEQPAHKMPALGLGGGVEGVVQALPIAGAEASLPGRVHIHVGEVSSDGGGLSGCGRQRAGRQAPPHGPPPVGVAGQGAHRRRAGRVTALQQALPHRKGGVRIRPHGGKGAASGTTKGFQHAA